MPQALHIVALASLGLAGFCALVVIWDIVRGNAQQMPVMNVVWPITCLWGGPFALLAYFRVGKLSTKWRVKRAQARGETPPGKQKPMWKMTGVAATHCGAGCTLGDIISEWFVFFVPIVFMGHALYGAWWLDFAAAWTLGIIFQYFTIAPMRGTHGLKGLWAAIKADTLSLTAWQIGMYGWMAFATWVIFGHELHQDTPTFWFMMQIAMAAGFMTAYPVNWFLLRVGIKEKM